MPDKEDFEEFAEAPPVVVDVSSKPGTSSSTTATSEDRKWRPWNEDEEDAKDPATLAASMATLKAKQSTSSTTKCGTSSNVGANQKPTTSRDLVNEESRKQRLLKCAPKLPYDVDLYHWEDEKLVAPHVEMYFSLKYLV